jgi:hypothetical protein
MPHSRKEKNHDNICEEILKERAAVLGRAGYAVEESIAELVKREREIQIIKKRLKQLDRHSHEQGLPDKRGQIVEEINWSIDQFNTIREKAQIKYYYLIVTREALGLRRHDMIQEIYRIPAKKKKIQVF